MSSHNKYLKDSNDACQEQIISASKKATAIIDELAEGFNHNTLDNIPQHFGDFLYTALGDRITGQRSSVLNNTYVEKSDYMTDVRKRAEDSGVTIEEQVRNDQEEYSKKHIPSYQKRWYSHHQPQIYLTAGRKFGVSYCTGDGKRVHTIYFGAGRCFRNLTEEHIACIKSKPKADCTQAFLDFRDAYAKKSEKLANCLVEVTIPVKLGEISCIQKSPKINHNAGGYQDSHKKTYHVLDGIIADKITHITASVQTVDVWDKIVEVDSSSARHEEISSPSYVSLTFLKIDEDAESITIFGNADIGINVTAHSLEHASDYATRDVLNHLGCVDVDNYSYSNGKAFKKTPYKGYRVSDSKGILFNMDEVLENPTVKKEIKKRIDFYGKMSQQLQELKHEHADLYFVNADI